MTGMGDLIGLDMTEAMARVPGELDLDETTMLELFRSFEAGALAGKSDPLVVADPKSGEL